MEGERMKWTKLVTKLALSALSLGAVLLGAHDGHAGPSGPTVHGVNFMIKTVLDETFCIEASAATGQEGRQVYITQCNGRENQRWTFTDGADGSSVIVGHLGMCLDIRNHKTKDGVPLQIWRCHYGANQRFTVTPSGRIKEVQTGKCLTIGKVAGDHKPVFIDECDEQVREQTWRLAQ
jgi:hypothetical protein